MADVTLGVSLKGGELGTDVDSFDTDVDSFDTDVDSFEHVDSFDTDVDSFHPGPLGNEFTPVEIGQVVSVDCDNLETRSGCEV